MYPSSNRGRHEAPGSRASLEAELTRARAERRSERRAVIFCVVFFVIMLWLGVLHNNRVEERDRLAKRMCAVQGEKWHQHYTGDGGLTPVHCGEF